MPLRDDLALAFIASTKWAGADLAPLAGDASNRRYLRLTHRALGTAVLMDAPPDKGEDTGPFIAIAEYLLSLGLSAPRILARDTKRGFLLLEDLGDDLFARVIPRDPQLERPLYDAATDVLVALHAAAPPERLAPYDSDTMADLAALAFDWYLAQTGGPKPRARGEFVTLFRPLLEQHMAGAPQVLIQRDYHAENLLWLPDRVGAARVGLLDFQDAMLGHPAYDLMSLLQDARRDVPPEIERDMIERYLRHSGLDRAAFDAAYHLLGVQRNLRIVGVFARLCLRDGKVHYIDLIPRVWGLLQRDLDHPAAAPVAALVRDALPDPTNDLLQRLKEKCGTIPTP